MSSAGYLTAIPSAIVGPVGARPAKGAHAAAWTPTSASSGRSARSAIAMPEARPPPPTGITTVPGPGGSCSASSRPSVPCPAIDARVVERVHEGRARRLDVRRARPRRASSKPSPAEHDRRAVAPRRVDLRHRGALGDEDRRGDARLARRPGDRLPVVACARGDDPRLPLLLRQLRDRVVGAPDLERARALEVLGLQRDRRARRGRASVSDE